MAEQGARLRLVRDLVEPVAMAEAQEDLEDLPDRALELFDRFGVTDLEPVERRDQPIREHQQRCLVEVGNQKEQEELVAKLAEEAVFQTGEIGLAGAADHHECVPAGHQPGSRLARLADASSGHSNSVIRNLRGAGRSRAASRAFPGRQPAPGGQSRRASGRGDRPRPGRRAGACGDTRSVGSAPGPSSPEWCCTSGRSRNSQCEEMHGARQRLKRTTGICCASRSRKRTAPGRLTPIHSARLRQWPPLPSSSQYGGYARPKRYSVSCTCRSSRSSAAISTTRMTTSMS
jgi:hypothetical protein